MTAPGVNILSTTNGTGYAMDSGTSMAAPFVTDYVAIYKPQHPCSTLAKVISGIIAQDSKPNSVCNGASNGYFSVMQTLLVSPYYTIR
jgi:subtilisin family serine protease